MKLIASILFSLLLCVGMYSQTFDSGSTGKDGEFNPPKEVPEGTEVEGDCTMASPCTVIVPLRESPDHVFNFTTVTIGQYVTVRFRRNAANTPVFILAQGDVTINGTVDVSGENAVRGLVAAKGGPGGFSGGLGGVAGGLTDRGGAGGGPGGGTEDIYAIGGGGAFGGPSPAGPGSGQVYGIPELLPLIGGSGGAGGRNQGVIPGGNGGGAGGGILIASSGVIDLGSGTSNAISANGGAAERRSPSVVGGGGGSGGGVRLLATTLRGSRAIFAVGGAGGGEVCDCFRCECVRETRGGVGRIRLESVHLEYTGSTNPPATFSEPGVPGPVFPRNTPTVRLVSVAGIPVPGQPTADVSTADITLPPNFTNPVPVVLEATNVPSGTQARVIVAPQLGAGPRTITPVTLTGPAGEAKRGTVNVNIPTRGVGIISAVIDNVVPEP